MDIVEFLNRSPSPAWAAESAAEFLVAAGFQEVKNPSEGDGKIMLRPHPGMLIATVLPKKADAAKISFRIIGAHTDSPHLRLKPNTAVAAHGHTVLTSEIYGGALLYTWFDRELGIAGEVYYKDGNSVAQKLVKIEKPIAIVPSLAIHLQRGVNEDGFVPPKATGMHALVQIPGGDFHFNKYLAAEAKISADALLSYDLSLFDLHRATRGGANDELLFSARLDNLASCFAAIQSLSTATAEHCIPVVALFDHEEIGSVSEAGAESALTENLLREFAAVTGLDEKSFRCALGRSVFLSADMAHGLHPNFADKHDAENRPRLGGGITLKVNQNRRYATSAATQALFHDICKTHGIQSQIYTHRNDLPCGSTIGPAVSARLGMPTLDVGAPMLGMHSIRETCAWGDLEKSQKFMNAFLRG